MSRHLVYSFYDSDTLIEETHFQNKKESLSFAEIFKQHGSEYFRELEGEVIERLDKRDHSVIALGGGSYWAAKPFRPNPETQFVIFIDVDPDILYKRITKRRIPGILDPRDPKGSFERLYEERSPVYAEHADLTVTNNSSDAKDAVSEILKKVPIKHGRE